MDRINIKCLIGGQEMELQLDRKAMPGETGPCFMITTDGCFKGYISRQKNGQYKSIGVAYYTTQDLQMIVEQLQIQAHH
ncbi:hypothetical protein SAMN05428975_1355 [Mucilaginibacter sp. OK268]|jgi:hypothetical protein|uniref:hypothetical protein n=1 Tax=Mucilaginibacter sp. OK268 TaxID=1881048 RepID=UPI000881EC1F|nr:hypothetical protein [Mucilaginibacter sp. OK268]SDP47204.1 hypothetical protein SAMN05428975_1355 [Mucilaginibacter sp. OK268]